MKDFIFVTWLYFQILLVQCDIFVNNLNAPVKMCIEKTINHLFPQNDTLNLMLNSDLCEDAIFDMIAMRPHIILNMDAIHDVNKLQYDGQFIICPKDVHYLNRTIHNVHNIAQNNKRGMGNSKFLVITTSTISASFIFELFWMHDINNVIILFYGKRTSKLFMCNRFAPENECGKTAKLMFHQNCEQQVTLAFTNLIHQMNRCPVIFVHTVRMVYEKEESVAGILCVVYIVRELSNRLNATFDRDVLFGMELHRASSLTTKIVIWWSSEDSCSTITTEPLVRIDFLWLVPKARPISNINICMEVFNYDVWIATSVTFISAWLTWFFIISRNGGFTFDKLCISFLNVWSLTICGNVARYPRSLALRIMLLFYLMYAVQMQFAFTSDMSTVLTTPRYGFQIRNLEELADSQLPIYVYDGIKKKRINKNYTDCKFCTKLQNSIHGFTTDQIGKHVQNLHLHGNYAVIILAVDKRLEEFLSKKKVEAYEIRDNSMTGVFTLRLDMLIDHYFTTTLNTFISRMVESGIHDKRTKDFHDELLPAEKVETTQEDDELTLKHLSFIFIFLGFGLCTACVVFCFELVFNKYL